MFLLLRTPPAAVEQRMDVKQATHHIRAFAFASFARLPFLTTSILRFYVALPPFSLTKRKSNSFQASDGVGFLVSTGKCKDRSKALALCRLLQEKGYLRHAQDNTTFKDTTMHMRFYQDEEVNHASLNEVTLGTLKMQVLRK